MTEKKLSSVLDKREKFARKRAKSEFARLSEVNARINHNPQARVVAGMTSPRTMHHGTDLCGMIAKVRELQMKYSFHQDRFMFGRCESGGVLLVHMPDMWYCLCDWDDFVYPMSELPQKILETSLRLGVWEATDE